MKHTVTEASAKLHEKICPQHGKPLEIFCRTDQKCICYLCTLDEHSNHNIVSAVAERAEKEKQVLETQINYTQRILEREEDHVELMESLESIQNSAQVAVEDISRLFQELIQSIVIKCSEVTNQISAQENVEVTHTKQHLKQVEQEIVELESKNEELKQLLQTKDDTIFLQSFQSFHDLRLPEAISRVNIIIPSSYEDVKIFVHKLKENIKSTKLYPDSASQMNSQTTSENTQKLSQIPTIDIRSKTFAESETTFAFLSTPETKPQSMFDFKNTTGSSTHETPFQTILELSSKYATKPESTFSLKKTTGFVLSSTPATKHEPTFGLKKTTGFRVSSTPATQFETKFMFSSTPDTQPQSLFGFTMPSGFGLSPKPDIQPKNIFGLSSTPDTQPQSIFELSSTPGTQIYTVFGLSPKHDI
ncbi:tripartite motif-containing protein 65-like isoform X2 [Tachysurus fulvidraco]|nr:tripartite motif-containing protein 65-like isoform X2 [Tachysurus fulvidraco]